MSIVPVAIPGASYEVRIAHGLLEDGAALRSALPRGGAVLVSDGNVAPLYAGRVDAALGDALRGTVVLEPGEAHKDLAAWQRVLDGLVAASLPRDGAVIALGGGVVGDVAGFAAASYMRGVDLIQLPTSLLAQVDAAVGGKTAVDHPGGRNLIGAFHQPRAVLADLATLDTLPDRHLRAALAEVVKMALIADAELLEGLERGMDALLARDPEALETVVTRCCELKAAVVAGDERERGRRALLNLGHTFAHGMERLARDALLHGEAVAIGLVLASRLAAELGRCDAALCERVSVLLQRAALPVTVPAGLSADALVAAMGADKKRDAGGIRLVLPDRAGAASLVPAPEAGVLLALLRSAGAD